MAGKTNRTGRVSAINYEAGTYQVTYFDRGESVTREINAISNGEYRMPRIGQVVSVSHNSNGSAAGVAVGSVWNKTNKPAEGYEGLYRKEYGTQQGQAYDRYDANTGVFTQYVDKRTGRNCNGEIFDEAKGPVTVLAGGQLQIKSSGGSASIQGKSGVGIQSETNINMEAVGSLNMETGGGMGMSVAGPLELESTGDSASVKGAAGVDIQSEVNVSAKAGGTLDMESGGSMNLKAGGSFTLNVNGAAITISAGGDITISSAGTVTISSPSSISMSAPSISISGSMVNVSGGGGDVTISGKSLTGHTHTQNGIQGETSGPN